MSGQSTGQIVGSVIGSAIGFFVGGPAGALQGYAIGSALGGVLDPPKGPTVSGPRLSDLSVQTSTYGVQIPRFYGTVPVFGNVLWIKGGKLDEHVKKKKQGGKGGGGGTTTKTYTYSGTFILGLGGPIAGVRRIWCLDKLIYNAGSDDLETIIASNQAANAWTIYTGTDDQMPDPDYEADVGVGNAPALRGMSYIKFKDFQLADYNNSLQGAQFKVEVVTTGSNEGYSTAFGQCSSISGTNRGGVEFRNGGIEVLRIGLFKGAFGWVDGYYIERFNLDGTKLATIKKDYDIGQTGATVTGVLNSASEFVATKSGTPWLYRNGQAYVSAGSSLSFRSPFLKSGDTYYMVLFEPFNSLVQVQKRAVGLNPGTGNRELILEGQNSAYSTTNPNDGVDLFLSPDGSKLVMARDIGAGFSDGINPNVSVVVFDTATMSVLSTITPLTVVTGAHSRGILAVDGASFVVLDYVDHSVLLTYAGGTVAGVAPGISGAPIDEIAVRNGAIYKLTQPVEPDVYPLASIIEQEVSRSSLVSVADIDTLSITAGVPGYRVSGGAIRAALEQPQGAYPFDVIQSGYKIKCVPRGQTSVATIPWEHLGANDSDEAGDLITQSREMDSQLPAITAVSYLSSEREYATGEQIAQRINTAAVNRTDLELAMVLTDDKAAQVAEVLQGIAWLERTDFSITLPPIYLGLEPSDVVTVNSKNAVYELRLTEINYTPDGRPECKAKPNRASLYISTATGGTGITPPGTIGLPGPSLVVELDIPLVDEVSQNAVGFVTAATGYTNGWPGAVLVRSADGGQTWEDLQAYTGKGGIGYALGILQASNGYLIDQGSLAVGFLSGEPESITRDQLLTGYNYAAYGVNGRWEIVRFQTATLNPDNSYTLSGFVRGDKGTEWATGLHVAGDYFILLDDPDNAFIGTAVQTIGLARDYRAVTSGASVDDAENTSFTYNGVNLECLSPVSVRATRDGSGNLSATFTRRSRLGSTWWSSGVEAPVGETTQAYEIDVMSGLTVKRTIASATPAFSYSAANQTTDFGSAQASITFRIYQLSEIVGRGYVREVTL